MKHLALISLLALVSCQTPQQTAQASAIVERALAYAAIKGAIQPEEAALVRDVKNIVLPTEPALPVVTVTATK